MEAEDYVKNQRSYYAIIPANVRYDKRLADGAKLLYGEITALCNQIGYCWATNKYFAMLYDKTTRTIIDWINQLEGAGYINKEVSKKDGNARKITLVFPTSLPSEENFTTLVKKISLPSEENFTTYNNTSNITVNTTSNNKSAQNDSVESSAKPARKKSTDERSTHPAIVCVRQVMAKFPPKDLWDKIIRELGENPDCRFFQESWETWRSVNGAPMNFEAWLFGPNRTKQLPEIFVNGKRNNSNGNLSFRERDEQKVIDEIRRTETLRARVEQRRKLRGGNVPDR